MVRNSAESCLNSTDTATRKTGQAAKRGDDFVVDSHDEIDVQHYRSLRASKTS